MFYGKLNGGGSEGGGEPFFVNFCLLFISPNFSLFPITMEPLTASNSPTTTTMFIRRTNMASSNDGT